MNVGHADFIDDALRRLIAEPEGVQSVLEGLARLPADVAVRLVADLDDDAPADFLEALLYRTEPEIHRVAVRALERQRSVRAMLALDHYARVAPAWTAAGAAAERLQALAARGELQPWAPALSFWHGFWAMPDENGVSILILAARSASDARMLMVRLESDGVVGDAAGRTLGAPVACPWESLEGVSLTLAQVRSLLEDSERLTLRRRGSLPVAHLAWQGVRWVAPRVNSPQLDDIARELAVVAPFRAVYHSDHPCEECASLNGKRLTVLGPVEQDPSLGIACRISVGAAEELAPLGHVQVGTTHRARRLLDRYSNWCREHLID